MNTLYDQKPYWLEQILKSSHIGILVVDKDRNNLFVNQHLCEMSGFNEEDFLNSSAEILHISHTTYKEFARLAFDFVLKGESVSIDYQFKRKNGELFWANVSGDVVPNQNEVLWIIVDITQKVEAQQKEVYQKNLLRSVLDATPDLIFYKDYLNHNGYYLGCNSAFEKFVGKTHEEIVNHNDIELFGEEVGNFFINKDLEMLVQQKTIINEEWVDYPDGKKVLLSTSKTPFYNDSNETLGLIGISRDITEIHTKNEKILHLNERMELALQANLDGLWDWNLLNDAVYFSPRWKEMLGYLENELENKFSTWKERIHPHDIEDILSSVEENINAETKYFERVHRLRHKDGSWVWIQARGKTIYDENHKAIRMTGTHTDITEKRALQLKYAQQSQIIDQIHDSVISTDLEGMITSWNIGSEMILGYTKEEILGKHISIIYLKEEHQKLQDNMKRLKETGEVHSVVHLVKKCKIVIDADLTLSLLKDESNHVIGFIGYSQDITQKKKAQDALDFQAHHDALTGLPNRLLFNDRLEHSIKKAQRNKQIMALLFIDLDHFKEINDSLGHAVGDEILKTVTDRLSQTIRKEDTLARLGGDEFTIIVENLNHAQDISFLAQKIIDELSTPIKIEDNILYVSSSIGISLYPDDGGSAQNLLKYADAAMYKAKDEGRNNYQFYSSEMTELAFERVVMETSLRESLKRGDFIVYYQAQVDAQNNKIIGMEALVRWNHPSMGIISPAKFIPLAELTGLIIELDQIVMRTAMIQFVQWYEQGLNPGRLALNLAIKQLEKKDFLLMFKSLLHETRCKAQWIELEVTEGQVMTHPEEAIEILNQISALGIELAIDDFGTGYSSLSYLKKFPIDKLKIDQSFIRDIPHDIEDIAISQAIIALAKVLNLTIIAEGVETKDQKEFLLNNGCTNIQGYYYSRPLPAKEFEKVLIDGIDNKK